MKFFAFVLAATASYAAAEDCDMAVLGQIASSPNQQTCSTDSGYTFVPPAAPPTEEEMGRMCTSANCQAFLQDVLATNPQECTIPVGGRIQLRADLLDRVTNYCQGQTASIQSADCDIGTLLPLVNDPYQKPCSTDSGYNFVPPAASPTNEEMDKMCASSNCQTFLKNVLATNPPECTIPAGGRIELRKDLLDKVAGYCKAH